MRIYKLFFFALLTLCSCGAKKVADVGGLVIDATFSDNTLDENMKNSTVDLFRTRIEGLAAERPTIARDHESIRIELPLESDSIAYKFLIQTKGYFRIFQGVGLPVLFQGLVSIDSAIREGKITSDTTLLSSLVLNTNDAGEPNEEAILGFCPTADTLRVSQLLDKAKANKLIADNLQFRWDVFESFGSYALYAYEQAKPLIDQTMLEKISPGDFPSLYLKSSYKEQWATTTEKLLGKYVLFVIDNRILMSPTVGGKVTDGLIYAPLGVEAVRWKYVFPILRSGVAGAELKILGIQSVQK